MGHHLVYIYISTRVMLKSSMRYFPRHPRRTANLLGAAGWSWWSSFGENSHENWPSLGGTYVYIYIYDYMEKCTSIYYTYIYIGCSATIQIWEKPEKTRKTFIGKSWNLNPCKLLLWENKREKRWERKPCFWELALTVAHSAWDNFPTEKVWTKTGPWIQWLGCLPKSND